MVANFTTPTGWASSWTEPGNESAFWRTGYPLGAGRVLDRLHQGKNLTRGGGIDDADKRKSKTRTDRRTGDGRPGSAGTAGVRGRRSRKGEYTEVTALGGMRRTRRKRQTGKRFLARALAGCGSGSEGRLSPSAPALWFPFPLPGLFRVFGTLLFLEIHRPPFRCVMLKGRLTGGERLLALELLMERFWETGGKWAELSFALGFTDRKNWAERCGQG